MDVIDVANNNAYFILQNSIKHRENNSVKRTGYCLFCGDKCKKKTQLFCCNECKEDYEKEQKIHHAQYK